jgi:hypothetical protein
MNCLRDNYDLIAVAVLITTLAFAPDTIRAATIKERLLNRPLISKHQLGLRHFEQPQVLIVHE